MKLRFSPEGEKLLFLFINDSLIKRFPLPKKSGKFIFSYYMELKLKRKPKNTYCNRSLAVVQCALEVVRRPLGRQQRDGCQKSRVLG